MRSYARRPLPPLLLSLVLVLLLLAVLVSTSPPSPGFSFPFTASAQLPFPIPARPPSVLYKLSLTNRSEAECLLLVSLQGSLARLSLLRNASLPLLFLSDAGSPAELYYSFYSQRYSQVTLFNSSLQHADIAVIVRSFHALIGGFFLVQTTVAEREADNVNAAVSLCGVSPVAAVVSTVELSRLLAQHGIPLLQDMRAFNESSFVYQFAPWNRSAQAAAWPFSRHFISSQTPSKTASFLSDFSVLTSAVQLHHIDTALAVMRDVIAPLPFAWLGWTADDWSEEGMTAIVTRHGGVVWAADTIQNLAVHCFFRSPSPLRNPTRSSGPLTDTAGRHTVSFLFTDGDSLVANIGRGLMDGAHWADARRGFMPVSWAVDGAWSFLSPGVLEFMFSTAAANDSVVSFSPGYAFPSMMSKDQRWSFAQQMADSMRASDLRVNSYIDFNYSSEYFAPFLHTQAVDGLVYFDYPSFYVLPDQRNGSVVWVNDRPCIAVRESLWAGHTEPADISGLLRGLSRDRSTAAGYSVIAVHLWTEGLDALQRLYDQLDHAAVAVVKLDELVRLMQHWIPKEQRQRGESDEQERRSRETWQAMQAERRGAAVAD